MPLAAITSIFTVLLKIIFFIVADFLNKQQFLNDFKFSIISVIISMKIIYMWK